MIAALAAGGRVGAAFALAERRRARELGDRLLEATALEGAGAAPARRYRDRRAPDCLRRARGAASRQHRARGVPDRSLRCADDGVRHCSRCPARRPHPAARRLAGRLHRPFHRAHRGRRRRRRGRLGARPGAARPRPFAPRAGGRTPRPGSRRPAPPRPLGCAPPRRRALRRGALRGRDRALRRHARGSSPASASTTRARERSASSPSGTHRSTGSRPRMRSFSRRREDFPASQAPATRRGSSRATHATPTCGSASARARRTCGSRHSIGSR